MPKNIIDFLSKTDKIPTKEAVIIKDLIKAHTLHKGEFLYMENKIPLQGAFVLSGILREFYTDAKGVDYIRRFAYKDWWIVDLYELLHSKPALFSVQAIEDAKILVFTKEDCKIFMEQCPIACKILHEIYAAEKYSLARKEKEKRSLSAQENYKKLLDNNSGIVKKIPLFHIASYLNIKPESLSRIRKQIKK